MHPTANAMDIEGLMGRWVLVAVNGKQVSRHPEIYFEIAGQSITGYDGCNRFGGLLAQPSNIRKTQRGCPNERTAMPLDLSNPVEQLSSSTLRSDRLLLPLTNGKGMAEFKRTGQ